MVTVKARVVRLLLAPRSSTVRVRVTMPLALGAGVNEMLPLLPGLVYTTVGLGIRVGSLEAALRRSVWTSSGAPEEIPSDPDPRRDPQ